MRCISDQTFEKMVSTFVCPASTLEKWICKNDRNSWKTGIMARVAAVVAPIFYLYQVGAMIIGSIYYLVTSCCYKEPLSDKLFADDGTVTVAWESLQNAASSLCEIPHKVLTGRFAITYFGAGGRYH